MYLYMYICTHAYYHTFSYKTVTYDICVRTYSLTFTYLQLSNYCVAFVYNNCYCCSYIDIVAKIRGFVFWESFFVGILVLFKLYFSAVFLNCSSQLYFSAVFLDCISLLYFSTVFLICTSQLYLSTVFINCISQLYF